MTRTYDQLSEAEQEQARARAVGDLCEAIIEGSIRFNDKLNHDRLQQRIDKALRTAHKMQTPWFAAEYLRDDPYVWERIEGMARCDAEDAEYRTNDDPRVVTLEGTATG